MRTGITCTIRRASSGYKITSFLIESQDHAFSICKILMRSPEYQNAYISAENWDGTQLFLVHPEQAQPAPYPMPQPAQPQYAQQQAPYGYIPAPQYPPLPQQAYTEQDPFRPQQQYPQAQAYPQAQQQVQPQQIYAEVEVVASPPVPRYQQQPRQVPALPPATNWEAYYAAAQRNQKR